MKKSLFVKIAAIILCLCVFASCTGNNLPANTTPTNLNENHILYVGTKIQDDNTNPLFTSNELTDAMNVPLVMLNEKGEVVCGAQYPTIAYDMTVKFVNSDGEAHSEYTDGDSTIYTFILKNNIRFSDTSLITADDVMFTLYTLSDPLYDGVHSFNALPIEGLEEYQTQTDSDGEEAEILSISGISKGELKINGIPHQTVSVKIKDYSPEHKTEFVLPIVSQSAYTKGFKGDGAFGVPLSSPRFMTHLKSIKNPAVTSGAYKPSVGPLGDFFEDGVYYLTRNEHFHLFGAGVHNAKIKNVGFVICKDGDEFSDLEGGFLSAVSFSPDLTTGDTINQSDCFGFVKIPENGYSYIFINPETYDLEERHAISALFDAALAVEYYPENIAETLDFSAPKHSFVYPQATAEEAENVKELFEAAGYEFEEDKMLTPNGNQAKFEFTLPTDPDRHPIGAVFKAAVESLAELGAEAEIVIDEEVENADIFPLSREFECEPNLSEQLSYVEELDEEILEILVKAENEIDYSKREELYSQALEMLAELYVEIPMYQRNALFVYDKTVLDLSEIGEETSSFYPVSSQLWKITFTR